MPDVLRFYVCTYPLQTITSGAGAALLAFYLSSDEPEYTSGNLGLLTKSHGWELIWYNERKATGGMEMQLKLHMMTIEDLVPQNHFLRKLEAVLDLSFVYEETRKF